MSLEGRLEDLGLGEIFQIIRLSRRSGILTIIRQKGRARLVFSQGNVVFASSDGRPRFGEYLVGKGLVQSARVEEALALQRSGGGKPPLGTCLVRIGAILTETLEEALRAHMIEVIRELLAWERGSFQFQLGPVVPPEVVLHQGVNAEFLLLEGARLSDEEAQFGIPQPESGETYPPPFSVGPEPVSPTVPPTRRDLVLLTSMIEELAGPQTTDITLLILRFASEIMNRAVVFLVREHDIVGLGQFGLVLKNGSENEEIRKVRIPKSEPSTITDVVGRRMVYKGALSADHKWDTYLVERLGGEWPVQAFLSPIISEGKVIAVIYGDNIPARESIADTEGLEAFIRVAGFAFGKVVLERRLQEAKRSGTAGGKAA